MSEWISVKDRKPADGTVAETKIDDERGVRNVQRLKRYRGRWLLPDGSMYVYYEPTHWRPIYELLEEAKHGQQRAD